MNKVLKLVIDCKSQENCSKLQDTVNRLQNSIETKKYLQSLWDFGYFYAFKMKDKYLFSIQIQADDSSDIKLQQLKDKIFSILDIKEEDIIRASYLDDNNLISYKEDKKLFNKYQFYVSPMKHKEYKYYDTYDLAMRELSKLLQKNPEYRDYDKIDLVKKLQKNYENKLTPTASERYRKVYYNLFTLISYLNNGELVIKERSYFNKNDINKFFEEVF